MKRVTGIGGVFFKSDNPETLYAWYEKHLGMRRTADDGVHFEWRYVDGGKGSTVWALFPKDTRYFSPSHSAFMVNYIVEDLDGLLKALELEGVQVDKKREESEYGRFAWILDPEGNRIELWEPPKRQSKSRKREKVAK